MQFAVYVPNVGVFSIIGTRYGCRSDGNGNLVYGTVVYFRLLCRVDHMDVAYGLHNGPSSCELVGKHIAMMDLTDDSGWAYLFSVEVPGRLVDPGTLLLQKAHQLLAELREAERWAQEDAVPDAQFSRAPHRTSCNRSMPQGLYERN